MSDNPDRRLDDLHVLMGDQLDTVLDLHTGLREVLTATPHRNVGQTLDRMLHVDAGLHAIVPRVEPITTARSTHSASSTGAVTSEVAQLLLSCDTTIRLALREHAAINALALAFTLLHARLAAHAIQRDLTGDLDVTRVNIARAYNFAQAFHDALDDAAFGVGANRLVFGHADDVASVLRDFDRHEFPPDDRDDRLRVRDSIRHRILSFDRGLTNALKHARIRVVAALARAGVLKLHLYRDLYRDRDIYLYRARELARDLDLAADFAPDLARDLDNDLTRDLDRARELARDLDFAPDRVRDLDNDLVRDLSPFRGRALDRDPALELGVADALRRDLDVVYALDVVRRGRVGDLDHDRGRVRARDLARDLARALALARHDFTAADLRDVDLTQVQLYGLRWSERSTRWPSQEWRARALRDSVKVEPEVYEIRPGTAQVPHDVPAP